LDAKAQRVKDDVARGVGLHFAAVAPACADLSQLERAAEQPAHFAVQRGRKPLPLTRDDELFPAPGSHAELGGVGDRLFWAVVDTLGAEDAPAEVYLERISALAGVPGHIRGWGLNADCDGLRRT
jgi:hypothetical protein